MIPVMTVQNFVVTGMSCEHCVAAVSREVRKLPGVERVDVDLGRGVVTVTADRQLGAAEMAAAADEAGYELVRAAAGDERSAC